MNPVLYNPLPVSHIRRPMAILSILFTVIIIAVSVLMVLIVLVQRPKQEGLGAAFGGSTLDSALGAHTTDILQKITTWLGILFFVSAIGLAMIKTRQFSSSAANNVLEEVKKAEPTVPAIPGLDPSISNLPDLQTPAPLEESAPSETPAAPDTSFDLEGSDKPAPAPKADGESSEKSAKE